MSGPLGCLVGAVASLGVRWYRLGGGGVLGRHREPSHFQLVSRFPPLRSLDPRPESDQLVEGRKSQSPTFVNCSFRVPCIRSRLCTRVHPGNLPR